MCKMLPKFNIMAFSLQGCADAVINGVKNNLGAIAGGAIVLGIFQVSVRRSDQQVSLEYSGMSIIMWTFILGHYIITKDIA